MKRGVLAVIVIALCLSGCARSDHSRPKEPPPTGVTTRDSGLPADVVASWGRQKTFFVEGDFLILTWEAAKSVLRTRDCRGGKQYHTGWLTIYADDGSKFLTKPHVIDEFFRFMEDAGLSTEGFATE